MTSPTQWSRGDLPKGDIAPKSLFSKMGGEGVRVGQKSQKMSDVIYG